MDWFDSGWGLTLAIFLPAVGMAIVLAIPKAQEQLIKASRCVTTLATLAVGVAAHRRFDYDKTGDLQFESTRAGSTSSRAGTTSASTASRCRCCC